MRPPHLPRRDVRAQRFKVSSFGQPRNPSEYTAEELAEVRSTAKLGQADGLLPDANDYDDSQNHEGEREHDRGDDTRDLW